MKNFVKSLFSSSNCETSEVACVAFIGLVLGGAPASSIESEIARAAKNLKGLKWHECEATVPHLSFKFMDFYDVKCTCVMEVLHGSGLPSGVVLLSPGGSDAHAAVVYSGGVYINYTAKGIVRGMTNGDVENWVTSLALDSKFLLLTRRTEAAVGAPQNHFDHNIENILEPVAVRYVSPPPYLSPPPQTEREDTVDAILELDDEYPPCVIVSSVELLSGRVLAPSASLDRTNQMIAEVLYSWR